MMPMTETVKRRKPISLTPRSTKYLEAEGWTIVETVERWIPRTNTRKDLFGFIDILAIRPGETLGVQVTDTLHQANRIDKIANHPNVDHVREAGWGIHVHGWMKNTKGRWVLTVTDIS
jgi:hypothetical protein